MVKELHSLKSNLQETLEELRHQFFESKSEKTTAPKEESESRTIKIKGYTAERKKKATRKDQYANLPVRMVAIPLSEDEKTVTGAILPWYR